ncbi:hypothetical protein KKE60_06770 [Patescibacteria group bacterium]|nr:hypothetical protein [Patescibacteria group bacterium]
MSSLRDRILARKGNLKKEVIEVEEWGERVEVREFTLRQRDDFVKASKDNKEDIALRLIVFNLFDPETGEQLFGEEDFADLKEFSAQVIEDLGERVIELSGLKKRFEEAVKAQEKN